MLVIRGRTGLYIVLPIPNISELGWHVWSCLPPLRCCSVIAPCWLTRAELGCKIPWHQTLTLLYQLCPARPSVHTLRGERPAARWMYFPKKEVCLELRSNDRFISFKTLLRLCRESHVFCTVTCGACLCRSRNGNGRIQNSMKLYIIKYLAHMWWSLNMEAIGK